MVRKPPEEALPPGGPFPVEALPGRFSQVVEELAQAFNTAAEIPAAALLAATAGLVGRAAGIRIKRGWLERPALLVCLVAPSGVGKTPVCSFVLSFIARLDAARARLLAAIEEESGYRPPGLGATIVDDVTLPALADALTLRPQGVLWVRDELAGLMREIHANPVARARLITGYDSGPWKVDRVGRGRAKVIDAATVSLLGAIQPALLPRALAVDDFDSGLIARFLFVNAEAAPSLSWSETEVTGQLEAFLAGYFERLNELELDPQGEGDRVFEVTPAAKRVFVDWYNAQGGSAGGPGRETVTKSFAQCLRLALVVHLMEGVASEVTRPEVGQESMRAGIALTEYFKGQLARVHRLVDEARQAALYTEEQKRLARALLAAAPEAVAGIVPTELVTQRYNQGLDDPLRLSSRSVGKLARSINLRAGKHVPGKSCRGITVSPRELARLAQIG